MAAIIKKRRLRTGTGKFGTSSSFRDVWQLRIDEQIDEFDLVALWLADSGLPQPQTTTKTVGGKTFICDSVDPGVINTERYLWQVQVNWVEQTDQSGKSTSPVGSGSPTGWAPVVTRRPVTIQEPAESLFYESGYSGAIHTKYAGYTSGGNRSPFTNSSESPFRDQLPPHQRKQSLWTIRWVRSTVPVALLESELKLNNADVVFAHRGYSETWQAKTAKIESVSVTETRVGTTDLWEITVEILHDRDGHFITALDQGLMELIQPGSPLPTGGSALVATPLPILGANKRPITEAVLLNGAGSRLTSGAPIIAKWRDFALFDFNSIPLVGDLVT